MIVKVCGMTSLEQVNQLHDMGVTHAGFIFYPESPRYVLHTLDEAAIRSINSVGKVGVFVNAQEQEVVQMALQCRLQMVQLHGEESPEYCGRVAEHLPVMKAFRLDGSESLENLLAPYRSVCKMFLFDTKGVTHGGTGQKFNWDILASADITTPYLLSGGIAPEDAGRITKLMSLPHMKAMAGVDINSRFEISPGNKDLNAIRSFTESLAGEIEG